MGVLNSFGALVGSVVASLVLLVIAILGFFVMVFIVDAGASFAGQDADAGSIVLAAAVLSGAGIIAGASPMSALAGEE